MTEQTKQESSQAPVNPGLVAAAYTQSVLGLA